MPNNRPNHRYDRDDKPAPMTRAGLSPVVLLVVGGLFLIGAAVCGGVIYLGYRRAAEEWEATEAMMREADAAERVREEEKAREAASDKVVAQRFAEAFVNTLKQNRTDDAYGQTSPAYRAKTPGPQFTDQLRPLIDALDHPNHRNPYVEQVDRWGPTAGERFEFKLVWTAGYDVSITTTKTPAGWLVDGLTVRKE